jgi:hypothetical protein
LSQHADAGVKRLGALQPGDARHLARRLCAQDVIGAARQHELVGQTFGQQVKLIEPLQGVGGSAVTLIGCWHVAGEELDIDAAFAQPGQIDVSFIGAVAQPTVALKLVANAVAVAVNDEGIEVEG